MGTLVNPIGWRLNTNIFWKVTYFAPDGLNALSLNNNRVYFIVLRNVLQRLNALFFKYGLIKFLRHRLYISGSKIIVLITFRFFIDVFIRQKLARAYKYVRPKIRMAKTERRRRTLWLLRGFERRRFYLRDLRVREARMQLWKRYDVSKLSVRRRRRFYAFLSKKNEELWSARRSQSKLMWSFYSRSFKYDRAQKWTRKLRTIFFMYKISNQRRLVARLWRRINLRPRLKLHIWTSERTRRPIYYRWYLHSRRFAKFSRFSPFIPVKGSGVYVRYKQVASKHYKRKEVKLQRQSRRQNTSVKRGLKARRSRRAGETFYYKKRFGNRRRWSRRRKHYNRKKKTKRAFEIRKARPASRPQRQKKRKVIRKLRWRRRRTFRIRRLQLFYKSFFYVWKIFPLLVLIKRFIKRLFNKLMNKRSVEIYLANASKRVALDASNILDFVVNVFKRRRRITKINRIFYRILRILRFFKAKYKLRGFKLLLAGRFLRRDRATFIWRSRGSVPLGSKLAKIDYAVRSIQMKYSKPIVKLWICKS